MSTPADPDQSTITPKKTILLQLLTHWPQGRYGPHMATASTAEAVAGEIRAEVARQRLTWRTLAQTTDITPSTLSRRMADPASLSLGELVAICSALGITPSVLLARAESSVSDDELRDWLESQPSERPKPPA